MRTTVLTRALLKMLVSSPGSRVGYTKIKAPEEISEALILST